MLRAHAIWKSFDGIDVLKGVDLHVQERECVCILGPSGSGKSTMLRCLNRLEEPDSGEIYLDGQKVSGPSVDLNGLRQQLGMVFQSFNLYPHLNALGNVTLALRKVKKLARPEADEIAIKALDTVGLRHKADAMPATLSGGQQQRVAIARAIALNPKVMLFDEPTSALDPELVGSVISTMRDLRTEGMTMVVVTHELRFAREAADKVVFMADGVEVAKGPPPEIFDAPPHPRLAEFLQQVS
ncbi:amino acid ABC transporter ATP-binding protein [Oricola indica]|jgi:polar amino acid transport system ATP-binding protein|uniref:amino acid ABC transporter ATP-binding protein n=1 Tax=Oricola indica TaxID=2872591 RepID=UPI001CBDBA2E|nr:amino acid ABC transporter ATP-binding protein [Oricola indica]